MKRILLVAAAATLALTGPAMAKMKVTHHRHAPASDANALAAPAPGFAPAFAPAGVSNETQTMRVRNLRDSGYNPAGDRDKNGNVRVN